MIRPSFSCWAEKENSFKLLPQKAFYNDLDCKTASLCYHISTEDAYVDMKEDPHYFDFSDYPESYFIHSSLDKEVLGNECQSHIMQDFIGLKPKMNSFVH